MYSDDPNNSSSNQTSIEAFYAWSLDSANANYEALEFESFATYESDEYNAGEALAEANQDALNDYVSCAANASDAP